MPGSHVLLQFGAHYTDLKFEDLEGRLAFTIKKVDESPNLILKLTREAPWAQHHPGVMGPNSSFFYFGPGRTQGLLAYGNNPTQPMASSRKRKRDNSSSRYFTTQNGAEYKWKLSANKLECVDSRGSTIAIWETAQPADVYDARMTIKQPGLSIVTELVTTLLLNRIGQTLNW
ncbi:hypothetical protein K474DRAFT_1712135 [Panus rudis PR-1116 ss-1]|nr:hypothetical protein K474DRAFT_1712135 [Panus rudis PR-1116 ss-1]